MRGDTIRKRGHVSQMRRGQGRPSEQSPQNDTQHVQLEILMFSRGQKLLPGKYHLLEPSGHRYGAESGTISEIHSVPVQELRTAIQTALDHRRTPDIWGLFELKRVIFSGNRRILVRGLGLADRSSHDDSRIVIVLEELDR